MNSISRRREAQIIAGITLLALYAMFCEYLPPLRMMHVGGDIQGYHWPLLNYAFQSLQDGQFPWWDPWIYCGISFAGNIQAQLFYPPTWVMFAAVWFRKGITAMALHAFLLFHYWILINGAYWWFRAGRNLPIASSLLGAFTFGITGYMINDIQHLGVMCALAWFPYALWAVDKQRTWGVALCGALMILCGYPATFISCAIAIVAYAAVIHIRFVWRAIAALTLSLVLAGIQLAPTLELAKLRPAEPVYLYGIRFDWLQHYFLRAVIPGTDIYLYLGAAVPLALALLLWRRPERRTLAGAAALIAAGLLFLNNPFEIVNRAGFFAPKLFDVMQHWNFHAPVQAGAALLVAAAWGPLAAARPTWVFLLIPLFLAEQYIYGIRLDTYRRKPGNEDNFFKDDARLKRKGIVGMNPEMAARLMAEPWYRVAPDMGPLPTDFRHYRMSAAQGFDPFLSAAYKAEVEQYTQFRSNREFEFPVSNEAMLKAFAIRYYISSESGPHYKELISLPYFRKLEPVGPYYHVFEYTNAEPAVRLANGQVNIEHWTPSNRRYRVQSATGGDLILIEQNLPGWRAYIDGTGTPITTYSKAFQKLAVPAGAHEVRLEYRPVSVWYGSTVTVLGIGVLMLLVRKRT
ncbi:hypothetical protein F183_A45060 [Bryobacterales bacterium F-183]|nr:hypothetical protein F183_A45060 [Bryobacterales bacterium F-183]